MQEAAGGGGLFVDLSTVSNAIGGERALVSCLLCPICQKAKEMREKLVSVKIHI